jgi:hypothetical protein
MRFREQRLDRCERGSAWIQHADPAHPRVAGVREEPIEQREIVPGVDDLSGGLRRRILPWCASLVVANGVVWHPHPPRHQQQGASVTRRERTLRNETDPGVESDRRRVWWLEIHLATSAGDLSCPGVAIERSVEFRSGMHPPMARIDRYLVDVREVLSATPPHPHRLRPASPYAQHMQPIGVPSPAAPVIPAPRPIRDPVTLR